MTNVASVGVKFDGADLERGIRALDALAARGPAVESALTRVEGAAARAGRTLATLGQTGDLSGVNRQSDSAAAGINRLGQAAAQASASVSGLGAASNAAQGGLQRTAQGAASSAEAMRAASASANVLSSAMSSIAAGFGAAQLIGITDGYTKFTAQIRMATTGATDYANAMASVKAISTTAQADIGAIGVLYARIASATGELGLSQKQLASITETVGLSLKASGATASESSSAMLQLSQAFGAGALRGEEFNAVNEAAPGLLKVLAESMGKTSGELKKMAENGLLTSAAMAKAFSDPAVVADMQKKAAEVQTISGAFVVLKNEVMGFVGVSAQSSGAVKAMTGGIESLAKNLDVLATIGLTVTSVKLANWMSAGIAQTYAQVTANRALLAANLATAQSEAASTGVTAAKTAARLAEVRAAALAAGGNLTLAVTLNGVIPAQAAATAAATAHTTALGALSVAQRAASASTALATGATALLGGPLGIAITLLGIGATAWAMWGKSSEDASKQAAGAVEATTGEILANLDKQIEKAQRRLDLARQGNAELAKAPGAESDRAAAAQAEVNRLKALGSAITGAESIRLIEQQGVVDALTSKTQTLAAANASLAAIGSQSKSETWMAKYATDAEKMAAELKKARSEMAAGSKELEEVEKRVTAQYAAKAKGASGAAAAVKKEQSEYDKLVASIKAKIAQNDEEVKTGGKLNDADKMRIKLQAEMDAGTRKATAAHQAEAKAMLEKLDASEQALALSQAQKKFEGERDKEGQAIAAEIAKINEKAQALEDEAAAYGLGAAAIAQSTIERLEEKKAIVSAMDASSVVIQQIDDEIAARQRLGAATEAIAGKRLGSTTDETLRNAQEMARLYQSEVSTAGLTATQRKLIAEQRKIALDYAKREADIDKSGADEASKTAARVALSQAQQIEMGVAAAQAQDEAWSSMWASVDSTAHDVFVNVATDGMDAFKRIGQTLKSAVLDMLYQMTIKKWIVSIGASVTGGVGGMAQAASATASTLGAAGDAASGISLLSSGFGMGVKAGASALLGEAGLMGALDAGGIALGAGNIMGGLGTIAGALGPIALGIGALVALSKAFEGEERTGGQFGVAFDGSVTNQRRGQSYTVEGQQYDRDFTNGLKTALKDGLTYRLEGDPVAQESAIKQAVSGTASSINELFKALGSAATLAGFSAGLETSGKGRGGVFAGGVLADGTTFGESGKGDNYKGTLYEKFSSNSPDFNEALENFTLDLKQSTVQALQSVSDIPQTIQDMLAGVDAEALAGDAADALLTAINAQIVGVGQLKQAFETMGLDKLAAIGFDAAAGLAEAAGGFDALMGGLTSYYANFYTEAERMGRATASLTEELAKSGVSMPASKEAYRKLVEEQLALGESGAKTAAELLKVAPAFAEVTKGAEAAQKQLLESVGINSADIATTIRDSMLGRIDGSEAGQKIAGMVTDGIYNAVAGGFADQITDLMTTSIITPVIQAAITGASITEAVSQGAIDNMVAQAKAAASALGQVLNDPAFREAINSIGAAISGAVGGGVNAGGGSGNGSGNGPGLFAIGGSANSGGFRSPELAAFGSLAAETMESNKKVSELLQKLLKPEKNYASRYQELDARLTGKRDERVAVDYGWGNSTGQIAVTLNSLPDDIRNIMDKVKEFERAYADSIANEDPYEITYNIQKALFNFQQQLKIRQQQQTELEGALHEWYLSQTRLIAVDDLASLTEETNSATAKTQELLRTGGLEDPITKLKESFASKLKNINEGINKALTDEVLLQKNKLGKSDELLKGISPGGGLSFEKLKEIADFLGVNTNQLTVGGIAEYGIISELIKKKQEEISATIGDLEDEQKLYLDGLDKWYKAQADLLSTEMLVDINQQIKALEAQEKGPLTTIKEAIQKYIDDLKELGTLDATAQAAIDKLSGLQLTAGRKALYDQLLSPEELKTRSSYDLNVQFAGLGQAMPATTEALRSMIDAARAAGNITLADSLLELVPAFVALQGAAGGVGDVLGNLRTATDDAYAALERAVGAQRDLLNESIKGLQAVFDLTRNAARELYGEVESASQQSAAAGRAFIDNALANAQTTGYMPDADGLREAIDAVRKGLADQQSASSFEAERDRLVLAGKLTDLKDLAEPQLTEAQRQLAALEEMLKTARTQIDELRGINSSVLSVADAMAALAAAIAAEKAVADPASGSGGSGSGGGGSGGGGSDGGGSGLSLNDWGQQLLDKNASVYASDKFKSASEDQITALKSGSTGGNIYLTADAALAVLKAADPSELTAAGMVQRELTLAKGSGLSMDDRTDYAYGKISAEDLLKKYDIPGFATGINVVPYDMTARIHEGEAVVPARFNPFNPNAKGNGLGGTERLEALVEGLTAEVQRLQSIVAKGVEHQRETAEILDNVTEGGSAMRAEVMA